jgi:branched-chain amino acid transport system substrate-binding protein
MVCGTVCRNYTNVKEPLREELAVLRKPRGTYPLVLALGFAVFLLVACSSDKESKPTLDDESLRPNATAPIIVPAGAPIVIGLSTPLSGAVQAGGEEDRAAVLVAIERWKAANGAQLKGHEIELRVEDDGCFESDIAEQAAERLLRQPGLVGVIGPGCSSGAVSAIPVLAAGGIVAISPGSTANDLTTSQPEGGFFFRTAFRNDLTGTFVGVFASQQLQSQKAVLIDDGEQYGQDLMNAAEPAMQQSGVTVTRESITNGTVDFSDLIERIMQTDPAFVGFAGFNPEAALLYRQLRDAGYTGLFGAGDAAASAGEFIEPVGPTADGVLFAGCPLPLPEDFLSAFEDEHGGPPEASAFVAQDADSLTVLLDAVAEVAKEQADGSLSIDPVALRDSVRATALEGLSGPIAFNDDGDRVPHPGDNLTQLVTDAVAASDPSLFTDLGLVACQVTDGKLVSTGG